MSDLDKILYTSIGTIIGGLFILVIGQIVIKFFVEPYQEYRKLLAEIVDVLTFYANVNAKLTKPEAIEEAQKAYRQKASQLRAKTYTIPLYFLFVWLRLVPSHKKVEQAASNLIGISNMLYESDPRAYIERDKREREISQHLHIRHYQ